MTKLPDIPGTYVFDKVHSRKGYHLNMFCMSLNEEANRNEFRADERAYLDKLPLTPEQRQAVLDKQPRSWRHTSLRASCNTDRSPGARKPERQHR